MLHAAACTHTTTIKTHTQKKAFYLLPLAQQNGYQQHKSEESWKMKRRTHEVYISNRYTYKQSRPKLQLKKQGPARVSKFDRYEPTGAEHPSSGAPACAWRTSSPSSWRARLPNSDPAAPLRRHRHCPTVTHPYSLPCWWCCMPGADCTLDQPGQHGETPSLPTNN